MTEPHLQSVQCLSPGGLHTMRYTQWGDPRNPRVLLCVHGLTRTGRDFDRLARVLARDWRVVCPDIVGRGRSDWLRVPEHYQISQYVADIVTLVARLEADELAWLGTSMGGLIAIGLAGLPDSPVSRLILNDVGPHLELAGLLRIGAYVGQPVRFASLDAATAYNRTIAAGFGLRTDDEWREITATALRPDGDGFVLHYDPAIGVPLRALTPEAVQAGEQVLWHLYDAIACPTLLLRGESSDLLSVESAEQMCRRGPQPRLVTVPGVGHAPMFFDPAQIAIVHDFLAGA
jgi:pimeloyl-ACP methyl ester carboxylesterase